MQLGVGEHRVDGRRPAVDEHRLGDEADAVAVIDVCCRVHLRQRLDRRAVGPVPAVDRYAIGPVAQQGRDDDVLLVPGDQGRARLACERGFDRRVARREHRQRSDVMLARMEWPRHEPHGGLLPDRVDDAPRRQHAIEPVGEPLREPGCQRQAQPVIVGAEPEHVRRAPDRRRAFPAGDDPAQLHRHEPGQERRRVAEVELRGDGGLARGERQRGPCGRQFAAGDRRLPGRQRQAGSGRADRGAGPEPAEPRRRRQQPQSHRRPRRYRANFASAPTTSICSASVSPWKIGSASASAAARSATGKSFASAPRCWKHGWRWNGIG